MKIQQSTSTIQTIGDPTERKFSIQTSAKAFSVLSEGLYSNPIQSIIRELSCNAYDAHVDIGTPDLPFDVHLPNPTEPFFSIRDYGCGLTPDQIFTVYTTYFESTKTDTNYFVGAFGLGSKSPFSYVNAYEVISICDGKRSLYSIYLDEDGVPTVSLMAEAESSHPSGIEVKFTVNDKDFHKFNTETNVALHYFTPKPNISKNTKLKFSGNDYTKCDTKWRVNSQSWRANEVTAVHGNIGYPIEIAELNLPTSTKSLITKITSWVELELHFSIGDLDISASREDIRYNTETINTITEALMEFVQHIVDEVDKRIQNIESDKWECVTQIVSYFDNAFNFNVTSAMYMAMVEHFMIENSTLSKYPSYLGPSMFSIYIEPSKFYRLMKYTAQNLSFNNKYTSSSVERVRILDPGRTIIAVNDCVGAVGLIKSYANNKADQIFIISKRFKRQLEAAFDKLEIPYDPKGPLITKNRENIIKQCGNPPIVHSSHLLESKPKIKKPTVIVKKFNSMKSWVADEDVDMNDNHMYVFINRNINNNINYDSAGRITINPTDLSKCVTAYNTLMGSDHEAMNIKGISNKKVAANLGDNWVNFLDLFRGALPKYRELIATAKLYSKLDNNLLSAIYDRKYYSRDFQYRNGTAEYLYSKLVQLSDDSYAKRYLMPILIDMDLKFSSKLVNEVISQMNSSSLFRSFDTNKDIPPAHSKIIKGADEFNTIYPMIKLATPSFKTKPNIDVVLEYIKTVDDNRRLK